jgi:hypothetical protein
MRTPLVATLTLVMLASCTGTRTESPSPSAALGTGTISPSPATTPSPIPVRDYSSFTQALDAAGFAVRDGEPTGSELFAVSGQTLFVDEVPVRTFEYPSGAALNGVRSSISRDGYSVPTRTGGVAMAEGVATPTSTVQAGCSSCTWATSSARSMPRPPARTAVRGRVVRSLPKSMRPRRTWPLQATFEDRSL